MSATDNSNPLAMLYQHERGMRWASGTKDGLKLSPQACANVSKELREVHTAVTALVEAISTYEEAVRLFGRTSPSAVRAYVLMVAARARFGG